MGAPPQPEKDSERDLAGGALGQRREGEELARRFGAAYCCSDYQRCCKTRTFDVVLILSRNRTTPHRRCRPAGGNTSSSCKKTDALTDEECRRYTRVGGVWQAINRRIQHRRFAPYYAEQKRLLARRTGPAVVSCRMNSPGISGTYWMADQSVGGAIWVRRATSLI